MPPPYALIVAAGGSTRMGQPKALLPTRGLLPGDTLIAAHIASLRPHCARIIVVLGANAESIKATLDPSIETVENTKWKRTHMADSIRLGLTELPPSGSAFITPVDAPPAPAHVLESMLLCSSPCHPTYQGLPGHPVLIEIGPAYRALEHMTLAQVLVPSAQVAVDWSDCCCNLNSPPEWEAYLRRISESRGEHPG